MQRCEHVYLPPRLLAVWTLRVQLSASDPALTLMGQRRQYTSNKAEKNNQSTSPGFASTVGPVIAKTGRMTRWWSQPTASSSPKLRNSLDSGHGRLPARANPATPIGSYGPTLPGTRSCKQLRAHRSIFNLATVLVWGFHLQNQYPPHRHPPDHVRPPYARVEMRLLNTATFKL